jgi:hypothetical protein
MFKPFFPVLHVHIHVEPKVLAALQNKLLKNQHNAGDAALFILSEKGKECVCVSKRA